MSHGAATISRLLKIIGLVCRIWPFLQCSFAKETYNFKEPTTRNHPIVLSYVNSSHEIHVVLTNERWGAGVETQKDVRGEIGGWGRLPFNETYAPSLSTIYDGA